MWFHRVLRGDSGALVDPFMHVGTYPTRHLATLSNTNKLVLDHIFTVNAVLDVWSLRRPPVAESAIALLQANAFSLQTSSMLS
jgi:hypothetical protein